MDIKYRRFAIGTKELPTVFLMKSGEVSEDAEDAQLFETIEEANAEIQKCDEPELFKLYDVEISVQGI